ncbi:MAG TPA: ATP-binding cassette domain-containing protein [Candidatus Cloacimonadota bacterium]|nr:ATP-binding cassette domain-containing protein [Candidatus Cloacimonadota bacterium]
MMPELDISKVSKSYFYRKEETPALLDISMSINKGEFVSLIGPSGCGKSTLLEIISGLTKPDSGDILFQSVNRNSKPGFVSYMPQDDTLFPWRTIMENVILPLEIQNIPKQEAMKEAASYFELFGLANYENKRPFMLSGGMRQRAAFLRTFLGRKDVLLLDEPFA